MENRELERKIASSYRNIAPDILDSVLEHCDEQKGRIIIMQENKKKTSIIRYLAGLAAVLLLVVGGAGFYRGNHAVAARVMLDVNPGIGISVNRNEKVLEVKPYNEDAKNVIGNMDFSGSSLDVTLNALVGSMLRNGYISEDANSILISVDSRDRAAGQAMQTRLMNEVSGIMESGNVTGAVLGQTVKEEDAELEKLAEQYGITVGKAKLIDQITTQNTLYTFADLVPLTINELNLISESGGTKLENIDSIGTASSSAYIGEESAVNAALERAQVGAENAERVRVELDWEKGVMIYEVDFDADGFEYEVDVNAETGDVLKFDRERDDDYRAPVSPKPQQKQPAQESPAAQSEPSAPEAPAAQKEDAAAKAPAAPQTSSDDRLSREAAAKSAAFRHAGVEEKDVDWCTCEPDHKRGIRIFEIEFTSGGIEYEYDINAETAEVIRYSKERDDDYRAPKPAKSPAPAQNPNNSAPSDAKSGDVGESAAKAAALEHAGVSEIWDYECERDFERGRSVYEISFKSGGYEYDYEISAAEGSVLKHEKERD